MRPKFAKAAAIAATQNGRITFKQLTEEGELEASAVKRAVRAGHLHRVHNGVYALGHLAPSRLGDWHGAVLAGGADAVLSHRCAATAREIRDGVGPRIDVTVPPTSHRERPGIHFHRAVLAPYEIDIWHGIPMTSPSRTMVDIAHEQLTEEELEWAFRQLQFRRLFNPKLLELSLRNRPSRVISGLLLGVEPTRSPLEIAFLHRVVRQYRLPAPEVNASPIGFLVDFYWPAARLIVETDGRQHDEPSQRAADVVRDKLHAEAGLLTLRRRWADVHVHHGRTAAEILDLWRKRVA